MFKNKRNRYFLIFVVVIIIFIMMVYSLIPSSIVHKTSSPFSVVLRPIENFIQGTGIKLTNFLNTSKQNDQLLKDNKALLEDNVALRLQVKENEAAAIEFEKLKNVYNISQKYDYQNIVGARILQKSLNQNMDLYRIDQGLNAGINLSEKQGFAVVDAKANVFGRIYSSDAVSSKVLPITNEGFSVSVYLNDNRGQAFILKGDKELKNEGLCVIENISATTIVNAQDQVMTSGLGGIFPYGLTLGEVVEVLPLNAQGFQTAVIKPAVDFQETEAVFIMSNKDVENLLDNPDNLDVR